MADGTTEAWLSSPKIRNETSSAASPSPRERGDKFTGIIVHAVAPYP